MEVKLTPTAEKDRDNWKRYGQKIVLKRISDLLRDISEHPETGKGKPEQLKYELTGLWSREINKKNRIIYEIKDDHVLVHSMTGHYKDK